MDGLFKIILVIVASVVFALTAFGAFFFILAILSTGSGCGIWDSGDGERQIQSVSDPSWRIPRWTDDGKQVVFDLPNIHTGPHSQKHRRDSIRIVDFHGLELKGWIPEDAPSPGPFRSSDYAPDVMGDNVVFTTPRHACDGSKHYEIASANLDGSGYRRLTDADGSDILPTWSPDGSRIAFISNRIAFNDSSEIHLDERDAFNVYVMDADGSNVRSIAPDVFLESNRYIPSSAFVITPPAPPVWSPNGWLAFRHWRSHSLYTVHPEKPGVVTVGQTISDPAWSPDGEWIAWMDSGPTGSIFVARSDGTEKRSEFLLGSVTGYAGHSPDALNLSWTPDGKSLRFVFASSDFRYRLYQISFGESNPQLIAEVPHRSRIVWSPDGSRALVSNLTTSYSPSYDYGEELLYTIAADGSDKRVLVRYGPVHPVAGIGE